MSVRVRASVIALIAVAGGCAFAAPFFSAARAAEGHAAAVATSGTTEMSAQRRRQPTRLRVYPTNRPLGPNAYRDCNAWYEQEYRPSGTVIVPRMRCRWVNG